ncbi:hypothetical protein JTB14_008902 [Gonioctena quinquepunctata]|nr:hypothetical protein JTB14_008902 [Gonioctena quinquepunctata]
MKKPENPLQNTSYLAFINISLTFFAGLSERIKVVHDADDFYKCIGDNYETYEYRAILNLLNEKQRERVEKAEIEYIEAKYTEILHTINHTIQNGRYTQCITGDIAEYETEFDSVKSLLKRYYPKKWNQFEELQVEFNKKNPQKREISRFTLIDEFREIHCNEDTESSSPENSSEEDSPEPSSDNNLPEDYYRERTTQSDQGRKNHSKMLSSSTESEEKEKPNQEVEAVKPTSELSPDSNLLEEHFRKRTRLDQERENHSKNPRKEGNAENYEKIDTISGEEDYFKKRTKQDQDIKNQSKNPRKEVNSEKFEDEYFMHLSNSENEEEIEQLSEEFRKTEKTLGQIAQQKGSSEPMQIENVEIPQNITMKSKISIESPPPVRLLAKPIIKHTDRDISDAQRNMYPEVRIIQLDGPTDADNAFSPSSEEEGLADLSMKKKNIQHKRNIKRRKTSRTKEELEIEQEDREANLERAEIEKEKKKQETK